MTKYVYTQVMDVPKNTRRWMVHKSHTPGENSIRPTIMNLVQDKGATMNVDTVELNSTHVRVTVRIVFNTEADRTAYEAYISSTEAERSAYETEHGITHTKTKTEEAE